MNKQLIDSHYLNLYTFLQAVPDLYLILNPQFEIVEASKNYAKATGLDPEKHFGKNIFEVFPDNPRDLKANGVSNLQYSLQAVVTTKVPHAMGIQKYDIRSNSNSTEFEERYWSPLNSPILDQDNNVRYIIHRVEDVTRYIFSDMPVSKVPDKLKMRNYLFLSLALGFIVFVCLEVLKWSINY